jgi:glyoxylase-like metal-dependent hydrolase (beta-lactamase superfamily II)
MSSAMIHEILPVGWLQCNCHVLGDPETREALVLDPGDEVERIIEILQRHNLSVKAIVSTHAHIDHVGGLKKLHDDTGAPVLMHGSDLELYRALDMQAAWIGMRPPEPTGIDTLLRDGDSLRWGNYSAHVMHTPGHTPGSICLHLPPAPAKGGSGLLLAGDTLFAGSIGRTDLWGGSFEQIMDSLRVRLLELPDETIVCPGHGPRTTIGAEREYNPFLRATPSIPR